MEGIFKEVKKLNKIDKANHSKRLCKLTEEVGELATEINKTNGRKMHSNTKIEIKNNVRDEAADVIQNVFSIVEKFGIDYEDLCNALKRKNIKWHKKNERKKIKNVR